MVLAILFGSGTALGSSMRNAYEMQLIMKEIGSGGNALTAEAKSIDSIIRRGESYDIRFTDKNGECAVFNVMVLGEIKVADGRYTTTDQVVGFENPPTGCK